MKYSSATASAKCFSILGSGRLLFLRERQRFDRIRARHALAHDPYSRATRPPLQPWPSRSRAAPNQWRRRLHERRSRSAAVLCELGVAPQQLVQALRRGRVERRGGPRRGDDEGRPDHAGWLSSCFNSQSPQPSMPRDVTCQELLPASFTTPKAPAMWA